MLDVLRMYLRKELNAEVVHEWADQIHVRDDIGLSEEDKGLLRDVLHELSNPYLTRPLTEATATELIGRLSQKNKNTQMLVAG